MLPWSSTVMQKGLANAIQNGLLVTVKASVNFYNKMGRLNLIASDMQIGSKSPLQIEFDALKRELTALGYFDDSHKTKSSIHGKLHRYCYISIWRCIA